MSRIDTLLRITSAVLAAVVVSLALHAFATKPISTWTIFSLGVFLLILATGIAFLFRPEAEFFASVGALFASLVIGRLFSTMHFQMPSDSSLASLDPLMVAETGPGIDSITYASAALLAALVLVLLRFAWRQSQEHQAEGFIGRPSANDWGITLIRIYVGLMFVAHFAGHLFAGPLPFNVFASYFAAVGLPFPAAFVILAGIIELAVSIGLAFGFLTRIAAVSGAVYLCVSVWLGGHFGVGYVWVLPTGGWEFPALWIFVVSIFVFIGAGPVSIDRLIQTVGVNGYGKRPPSTDAPRDTRTGRIVEGGG